DLIQDLYIKELRAYKPAQAKAADADAHVAKFAVPPPPPSPEETNLAADLKDYETQAVEVEGQAAAGAAGEAPAPVEHDWLEDDWEDEAPAAAH
ncbi:hypothetical protein KEM52_001471, partial [Ascosphaera acerosa]